MMKKKASGSENRKRKLEAENRELATRAGKEAKAFKGFFKSPSPSAGECSQAPHHRTDHQAIDFDLSAAENAGTSSEEPSPPLSPLEVAQSGSPQIDEGDHLVVDVHPEEDNDSLADPSTWP